MAQEERRRDYRFAVTLEGSLARARIPISVANVGYRGLLIATSGPVVIGQLGQITVAVPSLGSVVLHGVPVRLDDAPDGARMFGVRLLVAEPRWETFIRGLHAPRARVIRLVAPATSEAP